MTTTKQHKPFGRADMLTRIARMEANLDRAAREGDASLANELEACLSLAYLALADAE